MNSEYFYDNLIHISFFASMGADLLSLLSCLVSAFIFVRLRTHSPIYILFLALCITQFSEAFLDTVELWRWFVSQDLFWSRYGLDNFAFYVLRPLSSLVIMIRVWLMVSVASERWSKYRNTTAWACIKAICISTSICIFSLAFNMPRFFSSLQSDEEQYEFEFNNYTFIYVRILSSLAFFFIPYPIIIFFTARVAYNTLNKPFHNLNYEEKCERGRTKTTLIITLCFLFTNSMWTIFHNLKFILTHANEYNFVGHHTLWLIHESEMILSSSNVLLTTGFYLFFLPDYRYAFVELFWDAMRRFGCKKIVSSRVQAEVSYSVLSHNSDC